MIHTEDFSWISLINILLRKSDLGVQSFEIHSKSWPIESIKLKSWSTFNWTNEHVNKNLGVAF